MGRLRVDRICRRSGRLMVDGRERLSACHVADGGLSRLIGLLGTTALRPEEGLWIEPCRSVHTWGMRAPIAVAFLAADGTVCRVVQHVPPWRVVSGGRQARVAVEVGAGGFSDVRVGMAMAIVDG